MAACYCLEFLEGLTLTESSIQLWQRINSCEKRERTAILDEILRRGDEVRPVLDKALQEEKWYVREMAATALGQIGQLADLSALYPLLSDSNAEVRKAAIKGSVAILLRNENMASDQLPITMSDLVFGCLPQTNVSAREWLEEHASPKEPMDWVVLGALYLEESLAEEAFDAMYCAYRLEPGVFADDRYYYLWEQIHYLAGLTHEWTGEERDIAGAALQIMLELRPDDGMVLLNYGSYLASIGDFSGAYLIYRRALVLNPNDHFVSANLRALSLPAAERRRLDRLIFGDNVRFFPPRPNLGSDGVMSYRGYLIQIQIPNPPFDHTPETDDELLGRVIVNFLRNQGIAPTEFEIYQVQLIDLSEGAPSLLVDVVLREEPTPKGSI
ncbi:MAG: hypothetical protein GX030_03765 [Firmicutes bacterium]|nr:hypothetical protein [Bacillota bacterium]